VSEVTSATFFERALKRRSAIYLPQVWQEVRRSVDEHKARYGGGKKVGLQELGGFNWLFRSCSGVLGRDVLHCTDASSGDTTYGEDEKIFLIVQLCVKAH
jgi:hypothetical protein